jgi:hypothetical integral membrane protein (TIGR02206 family)
VKQFSIAHLAALAVLFVGVVVAVVGPRLHPSGWLRWPARVLAAIILAGWAGEYLADVILGAWTVRYSLPLQLTDAVSLCAILALLTRRHMLIELLYFWSFSASLQAILTPDLGSTFPSVYYFTYFAYHIGSVVAATLLVFGCRLYPRRRALWPVYGITLAWAALAGLGDVVTHGNYMYLHFKPVHHSLLDDLGPWPWYLATAAGVGLGLFVILQAFVNFVHNRDHGRLLNSRLTVVESSS